MMTSRASAIRLAACGREWDALVITPLARGLAALDVLNVPTDGGYPVLADHTHQQLIVLVPPGTAHAGGALPGVRVLTRGSWLLVPRGDLGCYLAVWLSSPGPERRFVDAKALRAAVSTVDAEQGSGAPR
ncbi:hypothetical protein AN218_02125 [Streptomyces nanshensis]|uniref:Uncharacterized protein n=2 Tax=Streptomyces nanshensis TaxID=518642 RepID=A0A1E7LCC0_9ACTN|nr:hypothetical protein AN218_02125 [Streptomyces nanshensis]